jgi:putative ABC transport system ATP-binding protein/lipoprotein-releasing system ATP-binding protein
VPPSPPAPSAPKGGLIADSIRKTFRIGPKTIDVLRGVSFSVQQGERVFLCGPSGAGKTTLLYILGGLEKPDGGAVLINGNSIYSRSNAAQADLRNQLTGYVFQNYLLLPELTALENVCLPAIIGGHNARTRAASLLDQVGLGSRLHHLPAELSGGEQQRVAIARALVNDPPFLFADEPTGNLDSRTGADVMNLLLSLVAESGKTLMVVTHDTRLADHGDRTLVLRDGSLESS